METPQLLPVNSLTRCLKFAAAFSVQRIFWPLIAKPRKLHALIGSRLWATQESLAAQGAKVQAVATDGDGSARSSTFDILRRKN
jgi:hypothetical protein